MMMITGLVMRLNEDNRKLCKKWEGLLVSLRHVTWNEMKMNILLLHPWHSVGAGKEHAFIPTLQTRALTGNISVVYVAKTSGRNQQEAREDFLKEVILKNT